MSADLQRLAERLLDGEPIDWQSEESSAPTDRVREVVEHLRVLGAIGEVHGTTTHDPRPAVHDLRSTAHGAEAPNRWGQLRILEHVGRGSFGDVYRAWDESLDREVALKLLRTADVDPQADAVISEGRMLARVRHPNVVTVYGAERRDGRVGLWMEFVRGRTLADIVRSDGPFSAREAALIASDVCRSVSAVHAAGMLHRDIKAQNVVRETGGRIVLMDFGAGIDAAAGAHEGLAGTPVYVAPEILAGGAATSSSDIYSLGVLLFFLVTGTYPVTGRHLSDIREQHAAGRRKLLRDVRPDLPAWFTAAVDRATDADPAARFQSAGAFERALEPRHAFSLPSARVLRWAAAVLLLAALGVAAAIFSRGAPAQAFGSVAVLPLQNVSGDPAQNYLAEGITDDLIGSLSRIPSLKVISLSSSRYYAANPRPMPVIARELGVETVVEGTVAVSGDRITVRTRLVDARADRNIADQRTERSLRDVAEVQHDIAGELATALATAPPAASRARVDATAYRHYLQARYQLAKRTPDSLVTARDLFQSAVEADPLFVDAHAGLAQAYVLAGAFHALPQQEAFAAARASAKRTLELQEHSMAYAVLGYIAAGGRYFAEDPFPFFDKALALDPANTSARQWRALTLSGAGARMEEAIREIEEARSRDPLSVILASDAAVIYRTARNPDKAIAVLTNILTMYPDFGEGHRQLGATLRDQRKYAEAEASFTRALELQGTMLEVVGDLAFIKTRLGKTAEAERLRAQLATMLATRKEAYPPLVLATVSLGRLREAAALIDACERQKLNACVPALHYAGLEPVRNDARIAAARDRHYAALQARTQR